LLRTLIDFGIRLLKVNASNSIIRASNNIYKISRNE